MKWIVVAALFCVAGIVAAEEIKPEPGEKLLLGIEAGDELQALAKKFQAHAALKAKVTVEVDDLLGKRTEEGVLLLDRPARLLRKFSKPSPKVWLLDHTQIQEYAPSRKTLFVKDFANAPKTLRLLQAAVTLDVKALGELFNIAVFKSGAATRLVLTKKAGGDNPLLYKRITARINADDIFFHQIEYVPESGDTMVEKYHEIEDYKPVDADFKLELPADTTRKVESIGDGEKK